MEGKFYKRNLIGNGAFRGNSNQSQQLYEQNEHHFTSIPKPTSYSSQSSQKQSYGQKEHGYSSTSKHPSYSSKSTYSSQSSQKQSYGQKEYSSFKPKDTSYSSKSTYSSQSSQKQYTGSDFINDCINNGKYFKGNILISIWNDYVKIANTYLSNIPISPNTPNIVMIGDVHGSFLQLLTPLIEYGFISNVKLHEYHGNEDIKKLITYNNNYTQSKTYPHIVYLGDIVDHSIHGMDLLLLHILLDMIENYPYNIYWCFGNHDMGLCSKILNLNIDIKSVFNIHETALKAHPLLFGYDEFKERFRNIINKRKYEHNLLVYYYKLKYGITCSHVPRNFTKGGYNIHTLYNVIDLFNKKMLKPNDLYDIFNSSEVSTTDNTYYFGHINHLKGLLYSCDGKYDTVKYIFDKECKEIENGKLHCCDLLASTFMGKLVINPRIWGYEFILSTALYNIGKANYKIECSHYVADYRSIIKSLNIINP